MIRNVSPVLIRQVGPTLRNWTIYRNNLLSTLSEQNLPPPSGTDHDLRVNPHHPPSNVLDVSPLAEQMRQEVRAYTRNHNDLKLVGILASDGDSQEEAAEVYSNQIAETFFEDGIDYELIKCPADKRSTVEGIIRAMNARRNVHGILVFYPIFPKKRVKQPRTYLNTRNGTYYKNDDDYLRDVVHPSKDVEGLSCDNNARYLFRARAKSRIHDEIYVPCTALAVKKILEAYHRRAGDDKNATPDGADARSSLTAPERHWQGCYITIINRSEIFGRPLAALLALNGATVYSIDKDSILEFLPNGRTRRCSSGGSGVGGGGGTTIESCLQMSSVVVTGVPCPNFRLPVDAIRDGTTVVNVSGYPNVEETDFANRPSITVISQVGKVTVAALEHNLIRLHQKSLGIQVTAL